MLKAVKGIISESVISQSLKCLLERLFLKLIWINIVNIAYSKYS